LWVTRLRTGCGLYFKPAKYGCGLYFYAERFK